MTTLVTGATGCLGSMTAQWLSARTSDDVWRTGRKAVPEKAYYRCDLTDAAATRALVAKLKPRTIFHMAGVSSQNYELDYSVNVSTAQNILDAVVGEGLEATVVLIGSAAEYGVVAPEENPVREDRLLRPVSVYGLTKAFQTQLGVYYAANADVRVVTARMFNLLAAGLPERLFVGRVERQIRACLSGEATEILIGNLDGQRDYVTIDAAMQQLSAIAARGIAGEVYHVGSGEPISMRDLLFKLLAEASLDHIVVREGEDHNVRSGYDVPVIFADMSKTSELLTGSG